MRRIALIALTLVAAVPSAGGAGPITQDACPGSSTVTTWKQLGNDVLENLLFAEGSVWVSDGTAGAVRRFAPDGSEGTGLTGIPSPGGLAQRPDGKIYAGWGNSIANAIGGKISNVLAPRTGAARVVVFDPADPNGTMAEYASGFNMPNGMALEADGDLYVSNDFDAGLVRIPADDPAGWELFADAWGTNGLVIDPAGENLYAAITFDQRSPIERIPLDSPADHETAVQLSFGVVSLEPNVHATPDTGAPLVGLKGLDDMTRDAEGVLYVVANGMGELLRVDLEAGTACLVASGLQNPSSVRIAPEPGGFADGDPDTVDLYVTEFSGAIRAVRYAPGA